LVVYLDIVILLNFAVDFLLILSTNRLTAYPDNIIRSLLGALIGSLYSASCLLPGVTFLKSWPCSVVCAAIISIVAFGWNSSTIRRGALFALLSVALGGIAAGLDSINVLSLILSGLGMFLLCAVSIINPLLNTRYVKVELVWKDRKYPLVALADTGNTLKDPITGAQVLVVNPQVAKNLLQLTQKQLLNPIETIQSAKLPGLRLIPYRSVGNPNGLMLGIRMDRVIINGQSVGNVIAFSPEEFGNGDHYQALAGGVV